MASSSGAAKPERTGRSLKKRSSTPGPEPVFQSRAGARSVSPKWTVRTFPPSHCENTTRSLAEVSAKLRGRKVTLYRNGDAFFKVNFLVNFTL